MERIRRGMLPSNNPRAPLTVGLSQNENGVSTGADFHRQLFCTRFAFPQRMFLSSSRMEQYVGLYILCSISLWDRGSTVV